MANSREKPLSAEKVTPHIFRHSKAMHLVQAGVNIIYIRDLLGHVSVQTTEIYAKVDSDAKRKALERVSKNIVPESKFTKVQKEELLDWLKTLFSTAISPHHYAKFKEVFMAVFQPFLVPLSITVYSALDTLCA